MLLKWKSQLYGSHHLYYWFDFLKTPKYTPTCAKTKILCLQIPSLTASPSAALMLTEHTHVPPTPELTALSVHGTASLQCSSEFILILQMRKLMLREGLWHIPQDKSWQVGDLGCDLGNPSLGHPPSPPLSNTSQSGDYFFMPEHISPRRTI